MEDLPEKAVAPLSQTTPLSQTASPRTQHAQVAEEEMNRMVKERRVNDYLRMSRAEFMGKMRQSFPDHIEGMGRRLDEHLRLWRKHRAFIPSQSDCDRLYLFWVLHRVPGLTVEQKNLFLVRLRQRPDELMEPVLAILDILIVNRTTQRSLEDAANGADSYTGEDLEEMMQADRDRLRDFVIAIGRLKTNQVDLSDETWVTAPEPLRSRTMARRESHKKAYHDAVDHPWLDETDPKGRKRTRGEKETIVMGLMYNGPQPRTAEDVRWRQEDKKARTRDVFDSTLSQHALIKGEWSGHPLAPVLEQGAPNRFGRLEEDKRADMRTPVVRERFERMDPFALWNPESEAAVIHARAPPVETNQ